MKYEKMKIGILGYGKMGQAIHNCLKSSGRFEFFTHTIDLDNQVDIQAAKNMEDLSKKSDVLFLCVKPHDFTSIDQEIINPNLIVVSIMAGVSIQRIKKIFPKSRVVRSMPNMPLQIGKGIVGWTMEDSDEGAEELVKSIFLYFGKEIKVSSEKMLNAITAISGSGPAYVFLFIKSLIESAENLGFFSAEARKLVFYTVLGSTEFAQKSNISLNQLIKNITSKRGTTEAALKELDVETFQDFWLRATQKAFDRAEELSYDEK